jgi:hypothetical protein
MMNWWRTPEEMGTWALSERTLSYMPSILIKWKPPITLRAGGLHVKLGTKKCTFYKEE